MHVNLLLYHLFIKEKSLFDNKEQKNKKKNKKHDLHTTNINRWKYFKEQYIERLGFEAKNKRDQRLNFVESSWLL